MIDVLGPGPDPGSNPNRLRSTLGVPEIAGYVIDLDGATEYGSLKVDTQEDDELGLSAIRHIAQGLDILGLPKGTIRIPVPQGKRGRRFSIVPEAQANRRELKVGDGSKRSVEIVDVPDMINEIWLNAYRGENGLSIAFTTLTLLPYDEGSYISFNRTLGVRFTEEGDAKMVTDLQILREFHDDTFEEWARDKHDDQDADPEFIRSLCTLADEALPYLCEE